MLSDAIEPLVRSRKSEEQCVRWRLSDRRRSNPGQWLFRFSLSENCTDKLGDVQAFMSSPCISMSFLSTYGALLATGDPDLMLSKVDGLRKLNVNSESRERAILWMKACQRTSLCDELAIRGRGFFP